MERRGPEPTLPRPGSPGPPPCRLGPLRRSPPPAPRRRRGRAAALRAGRDRRSGGRSSSTMR
ncbi:hypothetical protein E4O86_19790 [Rhizobiales bacterium L72]|uniref:Uncharacterized protein n=1 Tax=Propylenella binzhouense TaxID=2555902 RepID=A0A964WVD9_9HYPH|nr:hypothetical protein [Propylenella binzhouense]